MPRWWLFWIMSIITGWDSLHLLKDNFYRAPQRNQGPSGTAGLNKKLYKFIPASRTAQFWSTTGVLASQINIQANVCVDWIPNREAYHDSQPRVKIASFPLFVNNIVTQFLDMWSGGASCTLLKRSSAKRQGEAREIPSGFKGHSFLLTPYSGPLFFSE